MVHTALCFKLVPRRTCIPLKFPAIDSEGQEKTRNTQAAVLVSISESELNHLVDDPAIDFRNSVHARPRKSNSSGEDKSILRTAAKVSLYFARFAISS